MTVQMWIVNKSVKFVARLLRYKYDGEWYPRFDPAGRLSMLWHADKWNAITEDERAALLGQG